MSKYVWFDVRLEFYERPDIQDGYLGSATRAAFRSVCLPRVGELLVSPAIVVGDLPGPRVCSVDHMIDSLHDVDSGEPSVTLVAWLGPQGPSVIERLRDSGWRIDDA